MPRLSATRKELLTTMMKEAIFEAATSVLGEHGVAGMTMERVAAAAGLAKGSLYNYFQGKEDLLQFLRDRICQPLFQAIDEIAGNGLSPPEKLCSILREFSDHLAQHCGVIAMLLREDGGRRLVESSRQSGRQRVLAPVAAIFDQGVKQGYFRPLDATESACMVLACMNELFEMQLAGGDGARSARRWIS